MTRITTAFVLFGCLALAPATALAMQPYLPASPKTFSKATTSASTVPVARGSASAAPISFSSCRIRPGSPHTGRARVSASFSQVQADSR